MPDNIAYQPSRGNWIIHEDGSTTGAQGGTRNNDLWDCLDDRSDDDTLSDGCIRIGTLNDLDAEWTGGFFDPTGKHFYVSIQHNSSGFGTDPRHHGLEVITWSRAGGTRMRLPPAAAVSNKSRGDSLAIIAAEEVGEDGRLHPSSESVAGRFFARPPNLCVRAWAHSFPKACARAAERRRRLGACAFGPLKISVGEPPRNPGDSPGTK